MLYRDELAYDERILPDTATLEEISLFEDIEEQILQHGHDSKEILGVLMGY